MKWFTDENMVHTLRDRMWLGIPSKENDYFFGSIYEKERKKAFLYNLDIPKRPEFIGEMKKHLNKTEQARLLSKTYL